MLNPKTKERELAYIVIISDEQALEGYDHVHYIKVNGWWCIAPISLKKNDIAIYFEIDSLLPSNDERFAFMDKRKFRVRPIKMCKVISQGLVMPIDDFPEVKDKGIGDFVTKELGITLYEPKEDKPKDPEESKKKKELAIIKRHRKFFENAIIKYLMCFPIFYKFFIFLFRDKKKTPEWLPFVPKTDEERIQNIPAILESKEEWIVSEKVDGCSSTYALDEHNRYYVCSRNIILEDTDNIWYEMSEKYHLKEVLKELKSKFKVSTVAVQGETYGDGVQKRNYSLTKGKHDFAIFHIYLDGKILPMQKLIDLCKEMKLPHVHIFNWKYKMPNDISKIEEYIDSVKSSIDNEEIEGFVFYSKDGKTHFKCVSPSFILKYHS